jgi:hypothetical protein
MTSRLDSLVGISLEVEPPDKDEFEGLKAAGLARLTDASNPSNSLTSRFDLAYNAAHSLALAALRYHGYRTQKRYIVFQVLPDTLGLGAEVWRTLDKGHQLRNAAEYAGDFDVDERVVTDLIKACRQVADKLGTLPPLP